MIALRIFQGGQAEAPLRIEQIDVKDEQIELSDVEDESKSSKIFSW